ncbi:MAG: 2-dehydropantoate 2-reductase [Chloroflexota bacterium]|nr:2-dehydropantoate 2-reductase [Chloroflexota bacterium]
MKFAIYGAGAIGQYLGAKLGKFGHDVFLIARGDRLSLIQKEGITVYGDGESLHTRPKATDNCSDVGVVDYVFLTVKAGRLSEIADKLGPLLGPETVVVSTQNGIPWWYFYKEGGPHEGRRIKSIDPDGLITKSIPMDQIIGSIVFPAVIQNGLNSVTHIEGNKISVGELDGQTTTRVRDLSKALRESGLKSPITSNIRAVMWAKLIGNIAFNPVSSLTLANLREISTDEQLIIGIRRVMEEANAVAKYFIKRVPITVDQRLAGIAKVGDHKTSTLQDREKNDGMEYEAIIGAVLELGEIAGESMDFTRYTYGLIKLLDYKNESNAD